MSPLRRLGMVLSRSTLLSPSPPSSQSNHLVGPTTATLVHKVLTIAPSAQMFLSVVPSQTLTTRLVYSLEFRFQEQTLKSCQDNGNTKLVQFTESPSVTNYGYLVTYLAASLKTTTSMFPSLPNCSLNGMDQAATLTSLPRP